MRVSVVCPWLCYSHSVYMYVCIYIYINAVKFLTGPSLGVFKVINWAKSKLLAGPRSFSHYKNRAFRRFLCSVIIVFFVPNCLAIF